MSYANVAAQNAPKDFPHPDPNLLDGRNKADSGSHDVHPDVNSGKINVLPAGTDLNNIETGTDHEQAERAKLQAQRAKEQAKQGAKDTANKAKDVAHRAGKKAEEAADEFTSEPSLWVTALGLANTAILGGLGYFAYTRRSKLKSFDPSTLVTAAVGVVVALGAQSYVAAEKAKEQQERKRGAGRR